MVMIRQANELHADVRVPVRLKVATLCIQHSETESGQHRREKKHTRSLIYQYSGLEAWFIGVHMRHR